MIADLDEYAVSMAPGSHLRHGKDINVGAILLVVRANIPWLSVLADRRHPVTCEMSRSSVKSQTPT